MINSGRSLFGEECNGELRFRIRNYESGIAHCRSRNMGLQALVTNHRSPVVSHWWGVCMWEMAQGKA